MAEENKTPSWFGKLINWFKCLPGRIATAFKNMVAELHKVTWPSKKKLITSTITVLLFMLFMGVVVGLLDSVSLTGINALSDVLAPKAAITQDAGTVVPTDDGAVNTTEGSEVVTAEGETPVAETTEAPAEAPAE